MTAPPDAGETPARRARRRRAAAPPRYQQITDVLIEEIASGRFPVGSTLPPELDLCQRFGVSRFTMREALRRLRELGLVSRRRGAGTAVIAAQPLGPYVQSLASTTELLQYPPETRLELASSAALRADRTQAALLRCRTGQQWVRVSGLRRAGRGAPICWSDIYVVPDYAGVAELVGTEPKPVYRIIEEHFGESVTGVRVELFAGTTPAELAAPLGVKAGTPALYILRRYTGNGGRVFEVSVSVHPAGRFVYSIEMQRQWIPG